MATGNSIELAQLAASAHDFLEPYQKGGRVRTATGTYTFASGFGASGDTINLVKIPKGGRVIAIFCNAGLSHGGTATLKLGDSADDDKYRAAATLTAVGCSLVNTAAAQNGAAVEGVTIPYTAETTLFLTVAAANLPTSGEYVTWTVLYVVD